MEQKEPIKYGGGHYTCDKCGQVHFGSTIHYCGENMPHIVIANESEITSILKALNYYITKDDGQYIEAISLHKWDAVADKPLSINGKRKISINRDEQYIFVSIREDGDTRTVFNGFIEKPNDLMVIDKLTKIL